MTATSFGSARRIRPSGFDRAVMRLSLAMLLWARRRAERAAVTHDEHARTRRELQNLQHREREAALLAARVR